MTQFAFSLKALVPVQGTDYCVVTTSPATTVPGATMA